MTIYLFLFGVLLSAGLFFIAADLLRLPTLATQKAILSSGKHTKEKPKTIDMLLRNAAIRLCHYVRMDEYKKSRMANVLSAAGFSDSPELFMAMAIVKAMSIALCIIPCLIVLPLLAPIVLFTAILFYFKEIRKADEALAAKRGKIEQELPRFVATITQELKASRDVLSILENFKRNAGEDFAAELDILTADMRSSSYEAALTRFEARFNSPMLSDITRGLIGVLRGDDGVMYFQMLSHDMKQLELQRLKSQAMKIPPKIRVFSFAMLMCFIMTYMAIIVYEIITSLGGMFFAFSTTAYAAPTGDVAGAIEGTWRDASGQIKTVVNNVVFPAIDLILAVFFFAKLGMAYFDYRKHGQFEWAAPAILFACLVFTLTAPLYIWTILGM